jgi:hypothetical protein
MTVRDLKALLDKFDDNLPVCDGVNPLTDAYQMPAYHDGRLVEFDYAPDDTDRDYPIRARRVGTGDKLVLDFTSIFEMIRCDPDFPVEYDDTPGAQRYRQSDADCRSETINVKYDVDSTIFAEWAVDKAGLSFRRGDANSPQYHAIWRDALLFFHARLSTHFDHRKASFLDNDGQGGSVADGMRRWFDRRVDVTIRPNGAVFGMKEEVQP